MAEFKVLKMPEPKKKSMDLDALLTRVKNVTPAPRTVLCLVEEADGTVVTMCDPSLTDFHANWILDRAKMALHGDD